MDRFGYVICERRLLRDLAVHHRATHVLSLLDPGVEAEMVPGVAASDHLVLHMEDTESDLDVGAPSHEDVLRILAFASRIPDGAFLVVHCHAGISRSPAALLAILAQEGSGSPASCRMAARKVREVRPQAAPNRLIAWHADNILDCDGRLVEAAHRLACAAHLEAYGLDLAPFRQDERERTWQPAK